MVAGRAPGVAGEVTRLTGMAVGRLQLQEESLLLKTRRAVQQEAKTFLPRFAENF